MSGFLWLNNEGSGASPTGVCGGGGTNAGPIVIRKADTTVIDIRSKSTATTGTTRGIYFRHYIDGPSGECGRFFATANKAGTTDVHGIHSSVSMGSSGTCTGEVAAVRGTLHVPNSTLGGTNAAIYGELNAAGTSSDVSNTSFMRFSVSGNATGLATVAENAYFFNIDGLTIGDGKMIETNTQTAASHSLKCLIDGTVYYLMMNTAA